MYVARKDLQVTDTSEAITEQRGLKVIGAGFGRTGTLSTKAALETLGFGPCYHMVEVFNKPTAFALWEAATRGDPVHWNEVFAGYQATVDWPGCAFYADLMKAYPSAKVLLNVRDPEKWYESVSSTIYQTSRGISRSPIASLFSQVIMRFIPNLRHMRRMINALIWEKTFGGRFEDKDHAIAVFRQHIEEVKQRIPPEKLLVYDVKQGWEPLCAFLGVEVPKDTPFPHLNDRASFVGNRMRRQMLVRLFQSRNRTHP
jgi:sulfotransferase family protein